MNKHYISMTKLSMLLSMGLLLLTQFANAQQGTRGNQTGSAFANNSPWSDALKGGKIEEVVGMRTRNAKHFVKQDGTFSMYTSPASIHYQEGSAWKEIDLTVHQNTTGQHTNNPYYNGENNFKTWYPQHPINGAIYTKLNEGEIKENLQSMYAVDASGNTVYQYTSSSTTTASVDNSSVTYSSIFPNTNIRYSLQNDGRKFDVVLQNNQCLNVLPSNAKYIVLKEKMTVPASWTVSKSDNGYNIYDGKTWVANFAIPVAIETESSSKNYENENELMTKGTMNVSKVGNEITILTKFDVSWLKSSTRNFPVLLDPTTSYSPTSIAMASGQMTGPSASKTSGNLRLAAAGAIAWCQFNISSFPSGATINTATYWGYHFSGTAATNKVASVNGLQAVDPITSTNTVIYTQVNTTGPVYNNAFTFAGTATGIWYSCALNGTAAGDIAAQQAQGWTGLGFKWASGNTNTQLQNGYAGGVNAPYLSLDYSTSSCSGAPVGGTATSSVALACGDPFLLNLTGNSTGSGMTYQWQSSAPGANTWTNLGTSSSSSVYSVTQTSATDYRCIVTCTTSGLFDSSLVIAVGQNTVINCYCIPTGIAPPSTNYITGFITTGALQNISNTPTTYSTLPSPGGYGDYTSLIVSANPGSTVNVQINFVSGTHLIGLWADWNQDGDFADLGETLIATSTASASPFFSSFVIPSTALSGPTRLRVRTSSSGAPSPCGSSLYGEAEDYTINVLGACTTAGAGTIATTTYSICPNTPQLLTATVPLFSLGTTYKWQESTNPGGPYTDVVGGSGSTTLNYTTAGLAPGTYYYVLQTTCANCGPCSAISNEVTINVNNVPAPAATNSAQCAPGIPTAFVTSTAGALGTGSYNWYSASTGGTLLQSLPYGPVQTYYSNDFTSTTLTNSYKTATVSITGGLLQLHPNVIGQYGAFGVAASNYQSEKYLVDFDYATTGAASMAEGFSYSFGNDADTGATTSMNAENGTGSKLKVGFVANTNGASTAGIYLMYNCNVNEQNPSTTGVIAYSPDVTWKNNTGHVTISVDSLGKVSLILDGTNIFTNVTIPLTPAGTLWKNVNRASWKHVWKGRTNTSSMLTTFDNIEIKLDTLGTGSTQYLSSVATTTTFYVAEIGTNGCMSVRTPVTVTVNTPATITPSAMPNDSICPGEVITLTATGGVTYLWNGNSTTVNGDTIFSALTASTYTVTGTDGNGCTNTSTIQLYLHPILSGTASASPSTICAGESSTITSTATPICTGLSVNKFADYYAISNWTFANFTTNGTLNTSFAPDSVKINSGTSGPGSGGQTMISRVITCAGTVTFSWNYTTPYDNYLDYPQYEINNNGRVNFPTYNTGAYGPNLQVGTMSIPVAAGDELKIYSTTDDNDADAGILTIKNFVAPSPEITAIYSFYDVPTGGTSLGTSPLTVSPTSTGGTVTYYAAFESSTTGCVNPVRTPVDILVNPVPTATVSGGGAVCTGSTLPDVSIALSGTSPWNMTYTDGTTPVTVIGITASPYIITAAPVGTYSVTTLNDANCANGTSSGSATVSLIALPTATISGGGPVCAGAPLPDVQIALSGTSPWDITYTDGTTPVTLTGITTNPYIISGATPGTYSIVSVSDASCTGTGSGSVNVIVNPLPSVSGTITPSSVCYANSAVPTGNGAVSYTWDNGLTDNQTFVATASMTYVVTGTDANGCTSTGTAAILVSSLSTNLSQASSGNTVSNTGSSNGSSTQPDGSMIMYSDASCNLIASVQDIPGGNSLGATTTTVTVEPTVLTWPVVGGQPYTRRWFTITPTNNSGVNATVTLYQTQADFDDYNASNGAYPDLPIGPSDLTGIANIRVTKVSGGVLGVGSAGLITPSSVVWNATTNYWELTFDVTGTFSHFFVHAANPLGSALPANIISFNGKKEGTSNILTWTTSSEQNNAYFNLQYSTDGTHFTTLHKVESKAVNGNSNTNLSYQRIHGQPVTGHNYYRLEQVDIDGNNTVYSKMVDLIWSDKGNNVTIYPNPVKQVLNLDIYTVNTSNLSIKLMDITGRTVKETSLKSQQGMNNVSFEMGEFASGVYTIQVFENKQSIFTEKVKKGE